MSEKKCEKCGEVATSTSGDKWYCNTHGVEARMRINQSMMPFESGDLINVMMSVEVADEGLGIEAIHPTGEPLIPSIIFSMHKIKDTVAGHYVTSGKGTGRIWVE